MTSAMVGAQNPAIGEAEVNKCLDRIASVRREMLGKYTDSLTELQAQAQKSADLEAALTIRMERQRMEKDPSLSQKELAPEPRSLRTLQQQTLAKIEELTGALVSETVPRLVELKKSLTIAGRLDDAVAVRAQIERLQNDNLRIDRPDAGDVIPADTLLTAYAADRARADKTYKGARITVSGTVGAFRVDPSDARAYVIYITKGTNTGWVGCKFASGVLHFREEKQFNTNTLVISDKGGDTVARLQAGSAVTIQGTCDGFEDVVRLSKCEVAR